MFPFSDLAFGMPISRSIHVAANGIISLFLMADEYSIIYKYLSWTYRMNLLAGKGRAEGW